jgi:hypothetical protein
MKYRVTAVSNETWKRTYEIDAEDEEDAMINYPTGEVMGEKLLGMETDDIKVEEQ